MLYDVAGLVKEVRIAIDQNNNSAPLLDIEDVDTLSLDELIASKIADAARVVENQAPAYMLEGGVDFASSVGWDDKVGVGSGYMHLPDDFLRLVSFKMSDWSKSVSTAITDDNPLYDRQSSRFAGIRGCPQKPVVAIVTQPIGQVLEFYSCSGGANVFVRRARYIPIPKIADGNIDICEKLKPAVIYYTASLVAQIIGHAELSTTLLNMSNELQK